MAYSYGVALRDRVIKAVQAGSSARGAAARFDVGVATAIRWVRLWRETGSPLNAPPKKRGSKFDPHRDWLMALRREEPDLTLQALAERLYDEHGVRTDKGALSRFFKRHRVTFKKNSVRQ